ncbi:GNAT family N-acetyltransferase [Kitasatospora cinereorecta]|uniref:GNAT family N-acetyltransferase n=1 Tax=Kitasatospora cinereorecta TaxID=285560 RepID=A0ABW0VF30_9ACTN
MGITVRRIEPADWERYREVRLAMLADAPAAFGERYEDAAALPEAEWQLRAERQSWPNAVGLAAVGADGDWVGMAGAYGVTRLPAGPDPAPAAEAWQRRDDVRPDEVPRRRPEAVIKVVSVWVHPDHRGGAARRAGASERGPADQLLTATLEWAREQSGADRAVLEVHEENARARAFYRRHGFAPSGLTRPYPLDPAARLLELELDLRAVRGA